MSEQTQNPPRVWTWVASAIAAILLLYFRPLTDLFHLALSDENVSHTLLIPLVTAYVLRIDRRHIFESSARDNTAGWAFFISAIISTSWAYYGDTRLHSADALTYYILGCVLACLAVFAFAFGRRVLRQGAFPFVLLFLMIPWPAYILNPVISYLQNGSADIAAIIFSASGAPVLRQGLFFYLPRATIEVAAECSGIRSSMALLILALIVAHFSFRPLWKKILFVAAGLLVMIVKNGIRIATLTLLANYVDPGFLFGNLHREGGAVFFLIGLLLLVPLYWVLKKGEHTASGRFPLSAVNSEGQSA